MRLSLTRKLLAAFLGVSLVGLLTAALGVFGLRSMESRMTEIVARKWVAADMAMEYWIGSLTKTWALHQHMEGNTEQARDASVWAEGFIQHTLDTLREKTDAEPEQIGALAARDASSDELRRGMIARFDEEREIARRFSDRASELNAALRSLEERMDAVGEKAVQSQDANAAHRAWDAADSTMEMWIAALTLSSAPLLLEDPKPDAAAERTAWAHDFFNDQMRRLRATGHAEASELDRIDALYRDLEGLSQRIFDAHAQGIVAMREFDRNTEALRNLIQPIEESHDLAMDEAVARAVRATHSFRMALLGVTLAGVAIAVAIGLLIARGVTTPLGELARAARDLARGDVARRVEVASSDEVGDLGRAFNDMARDLEESNERLRRSESAYRNIVNNAVIGLYRSDAEGRLQMANRRLLEVLGRDAETPAREIVLPQVFADRARWRDLAAQVAAQGEVRDFEAEMRRSDGSRLDVVLSARRDPESDMLEGTIQDITQRRLLEQKIIQSEKLSAIGQLAAGISHEMRNPLGILSNALYDLRQIVRDDNPETREDFSIASEELNRLNGIIANLLEFSREGTSEPEPVDVNLLVERTLKLMAKSLTNQSILVETQLGEIPRARFNGNAFKQVFINLVTNAAQAMPNGGRLCVRSAIAEGLIRLEVEDSGVGISPTDLPRVFNPFFTTKAAGKGTGLGLSIVHSTMRKYEGDIRVKSAVGRGTTFTLDFPVAVDAAGDAT